MTFKRLSNICKLSVIIIIVALIMGIVLSIPSLAEKQEFEFIENNDTTQDIKIVENGEAEILLNKSISQISGVDRKHIMLSANAQIEYRLPISAFIKIYSTQSITAIAIILIIILFIIIYIKKRSFAKLKKIAYTDMLTGGNNLAKLKLDAYCLFNKYGTEGYSVVLIDIDKFKYINHMFGYQEGDKTLKYVHNILMSSIESNEICARVSADWFALILKSKNSKNLTERVVKIFNDISKFDGLGAEHYEIIIKCGIYIIEEGEKDLNKMLDKAIITRETVRGRHKSSYEFYTNEIKDKIVKEKEIENKMVSALNNQEFIIYMQPKYNLQSRKIVGAEALVRWDDPIKGILPPMDFIPFFEKNGFIVVLDSYIFESVCKQIRWWLDNGYNPLPISVNISRVNLHQSEFVENYKAIVKKYRIPSELLELELTESAIFENEDLLLTIVDEFKKIGISLSIDDFGSGYSCLSLLGIIPFDTLKIDRKFLMKNFKTIGGKIVVKKIVELAKSLKLSVVSEGVETSEQEDFLKSIGCDMAQGYLFARPMPIDAFNTLIE